jgi:hypothetical protein
MEETFECTIIFSEDGLERAQLIELQQLAQFTWWQVSKFELGGHIQY